MENQRGFHSRARDAGGHRQGPGNGPSQHAATLNGDDLHGGRRRRPHRSSRSEGQGPDEGGLYPEAFGPLHGARGEIVWFNSSMYEQAEGYFQSTLDSSGAPPPPSSSTGERVHRSLVFRAKRKATQQNHAQGGHELRAHQRSSSEPQRGRQGPRGGRKRVFSETERAPQRARDNISMSGLQALAHDKVWFDKSKYDEAERRFFEVQSGVPQETDASAILQDIAKARQTVQQSLAGVKAALQPGKGHPRAQKPRERRTSQNANKSEDQSELISRLKNLEQDNKNLHKVVDDLRAMLSKLESRMTLLEKTQSRPPKPAPAPQTAPASNPKVAVKEEEEEEDDDVDLFASDEEDEEAERIKAQRVQEYTARKATKPALIAKSSILLDVKPWDDETDMAKLEECVRSVQMDGLLWGASKLVPVGYGIKKLQISCVVEDDKVGTDILEEEITKFEDYVQSVDVAAFNKI
ncbi:eukaryotic translation elongation factor 1 delta a (guanine nucleotide exchange protein) isoform X1 [Electrophorus electricus]|nr:eukaryotic translation elongation factor 1 delta a (guanine nucleotide exchange protein) isoform X1 [Electrophorus electricus]XP_026876979.2 eukaryotic translation elongation factor 1 delta a (guanine nucleotide exchange protein) isoform X1 [Electrophorus electricus]